MSKIIWDAVGEKFFETGLSKGVLFPTIAGVYQKGVPWNGLISVAESPSGAELTDLWADDIKYASLRSTEQFGATIEAYTYPPEFAACDGSAALVDGVMIGQQSRAPFGFCYRTIVGNDVDSDSAGYKLHIVYGASANPSEKNFQSVNDSPEAITFSWEVSTIPVAVASHKPTSTVVIDSTKVNPTKLAALEDILYGTAGVDPRLPLPDEIKELMLGTEATPASPTFVANTGVLTVPETTGIVYLVNGVEANAGAQNAVDGGVTLVVTATPDTGYYIPAGVNTKWTFVSTKP